MTTLYCATGNPGKLREFRQAAGPDFDIRPCASLDCPETGTTFEENALQKAACYAAALKEQALQQSSGRQPATTTRSTTAGAGRTLTGVALCDQVLLFADDSGIEVDALDGAPGVYSARFAGPDADDAANNALLLEELAGVPADRRTARYVCVIALLRGSELVGSFRAEAEGVILQEPKGEGGFGYDPYFFSPALGQTFAEAPADLKWLYSHRGKAFRAMLERL